MAISAGEIEILLRARDEMSRVLDRAQESIQRIAPSAQGATRELAGMERQTSLVASVMEGLGPRVVAAMSTSAVIAATRAMANWSSEVATMAQRLDISTDSVQQLDFAARTNNTSINSIAASIAVLSRGLVSGDGGVVQALGRLGLSLEEVRAMRADQAFLEIGRRIAELPAGFEQSTVAVQAFGRGGNELIPLFRSNLQALIDLAPLLRRSLIEQGDALDASWTRLVASGRTLLASVLIPLEPVVTNVARAVGWFANAQDQLGRTLENAHRHFLNLPSTVNLSREATERATEANQRYMRVNVPGFLTDYERIQRELTASALAKIRATERATAADSAHAENVGLVYGELDDLTRLQLDYNVTIGEYVTDAGMAEAATQELSDQFHRLAGTQERITSDLPSYTLLLQNLETTLDDTAVRTAVATTRTRAWHDGLGELASAFSTLAQVSGGAFGDVVRHIGTVIAAMDLAQRSGAQLKAGFEQIETGGTRNVVAGMAQMGTGIAGGIASMLQATAHGNTLSRTLGGMASGAALGTAIFPGLGTAIGAVGGALVGFARGAFGVSEAIQAARRSSEEFQTALHATLTETERNSAGNQRWVMTVIAVRDAYIATGRSAADAEAIVRQLWDTDHPDRARAAIEQINRVLREQEEIQQRLDAGMERASAGMTTWLQIGMQALDGITAGRTRLAELTAQYDSADEAGKARIALEIQRVTQQLAEQETLQRTVGVTTQASATAAAAALGAMFAQYREGGMTTREALEAIEPAAQALERQLEAAGLTGTESFDEIRRYMDIASDAIGGPALDAVSGLNDAMMGLHDAGLLDQEMFEGLAGQVAHTFNSLVEQGHDGTDAMRLMQPTLQDIWRLQEDFGFAVDESTQALIDQAVEAGVVGDAHRDASDRAAVAMERMADTLDRIADVMGAGLPRAFDLAGEAADDLVDRINDRLSEIPDEIVIDFTGRDNLHPDGGGSGDGGSQTGFATGTHGRLIDFGSGTNVTLHGRERVQTEREVRSEASSVGALAAEIGAMREEFRAFLPGILSRSVGTAVAQAMATRR